MYRSAITSGQISMTNRADTCPASTAKHALISSSSDPRR
jgi:hypothetical protein